MYTASHPRVTRTIFPTDIDPLSITKQMLAMPVLKILSLNLFGRITLGYWDVEENGMTSNVTMTAYVKSNGNVWP